MAGLGKQTRVFCFVFVLQWGIIPFVDTTYVKKKKALKHKGSHKNKADILLNTRDGGSNTQADNTWTHDHNGEFHLGWFPVVLVFSFAGKYFSEIHDCLIREPAKRVTELYCV